MANTLITIDVFRAEDMCVIDGVLTGETLGFADELVLDDIYALAATSAPLSLDLVTGQAGLRRKTGARNAVHLDCCLTLMAPDGTPHDALVLVEESAGLAIAIYLMALGDIVPDQSYRLVRIARETATRRFAPVVVTQGALHNDADLVLRPDHRIFVYQRSDLLGAGHAEVLIRARQLVDDVTVLRRRGGYVDYFQLVFDDHHIIYAEGIAAESHLVDTMTRHALPADVPLHRHGPHLAYQVRDSLIDPATAAALLRRASTS
ncbi:MAG: Hint domain-containing protein [Proteobacteria bacterium]|nr:Hint domain-containing protein [Pseudomonadota bacterium]